MMRALLVMLMLATSALAERTVTFAWDASPDADSYMLYVNGAPIASTSETQITVQIADARTAVNVTAVNITGESEPSATLIVPLAPSIPKGFRISKIVRTTTATPK
jgi:hypothetical protein